jgi:hypothetical protein
VPPRRVPSTFGSLDDEFLRLWPRDDRTSLASLIAAVAVGVAIRVALAFAANGKSWSDSAVIALRAPAAAASAAHHSLVSRAVEAPEYHQKERWPS